MPDFGAELRDMTEFQVGFHWYQAVLLLLDLNDGSLVDHAKSSCVIAFPIIYPYRVVGERYKIGTWQIVDSESEFRKSSQMRCGVSLVQHD